MIWKRWWPKANSVISNTLTVFSVKELSEEELRNGEEKVEEKYSLIESIKMLVHNKYYIVILVVDILRQTYSAIINCGIYYMTYVLGKAELLGTFSGAINLALIVGLAFLPMLVAKYKGYYKLNFSGYLIAAAGRGIVIIAGYMGNVPLMLAGTAIGAIGMAPWQGNLQALKQDAVIEISITSPEGKNYCSNITLNAAHIEMFEQLKSMKIRSIPGNME